MPTAKPTVEKSRSKDRSKATDSISHDHASGTRKQSEDPPDFDDDKVQERWTEIIARQHEELATNVLQITTPRGKLDEIAKKELDGLLAELICPNKLRKGGGGGSSVTPKTLEEHVRAFIVDSGIASEVKKVTQRLNARHMTDGQRWVLSKTYVWLLNNLFKDKNAKQGKNAKIDTLVQDDLGMAEKVMLDLEKEGGPLDTFAQLLVLVVMKRNRIGESETLQQLVAQQVRRAIRRGDLYA